MSTKYTSRGPAAINADRSCELVPNEILTIELKLMQHHLTNLLLPVFPLESVIHTMVRSSGVLMLDVVSSMMKLMSFCCQGKRASSSSNIFISEPSYKTSFVNTGPSDVSLFEQYVFACSQDPCIGDSVIWERCTSNSHESSFSNVLLRFRTRVLQHP